MDKSGRCVGLTNVPPPCAECLETWEPVHACNVIPLPLTPISINITRICFNMQWRFIFSASRLEEARALVVDLVCPKTRILVLETNAYKILCYQDGVLT